MLCRIKQGLCFSQTEILSEVRRYEEAAQSSTEEHNVLMGKAVGTGDYTSLGKYDLASAQADRILKIPILSTMRLQSCELAS